MEHKLISENGIVLLVIEDNSITIEDGNIYVDELIRCFKNSIRKLMARSLLTVCVGSTKLRLIFVGKWQTPTFLAGSGLWESQASDFKKDMEEMRRKFIDYVKRESVDTFLRSWLGEPDITQRKMLNMVEFQRPIAPKAVSSD